MVKIGFYMTKLQSAEDIGKTTLEHHYSYSVQEMASEKTPKIRK